MAKVTEQDRKDLSKALSYANWSVLGLFIPFVGWLLAGISLSFIKTVPRTTETAARLNQIKKMAWIGIIVSSIAVAVWGGLYRFNSQMKRREQVRAEQQKKDEQTRIYWLSVAEEKRKTTEKVQLQSCIENANKWYDDNSTGLHQADYWNSLLARKKQYVDKCQVKYPVN